MGVYRTYGLEHGSVTDQEQMHRLMSAIAKEDFSSSSNKNKEEEALDVAKFLYGVISHLIPKSDSQKELEILVEILTKMKNK